MRNLIIEKLEARMLRKDPPILNSGDTVRVHTKIREGEKERVQIFEGVVIGQRAAGNRSTFTVRKVSYGVGVERIFPMHSPRIDRVEVVSGGVVRRSKLFYLRGLQGKAARLKEQEAPDTEPRAAAPATAKA